MYKLCHYINEESGDEFVVIVSDNEKPESFERNGFKLSTSLDIDGDAGSMPCDREIYA